MGKHEEYGKKLLAELLGERWDPLASDRSVDEAGVRADLDGVIRLRDSGPTECAVEIEARVYKQIRGAIVDLALHPAPKKLLVIIPAQPQLRDEMTTAEHCKYVWQQLTAGTRGRFQVVCLQGTGTRRAPGADKVRLEHALRALEVFVP